MNRRHELLRSFVIQEIYTHFEKEMRAKPYDKNIFDDETINQESILVPDDIKDSIKKWLNSMNLV
jgi:hypothetical protein